MAANDDNNEIILDIEVRYEDAINNIAKYTQSVQDLREENAKLRKDMKEEKISREDYNKAVASNNEIISQYNERIRVNRREIQNNIKIEKEQEGSIKSLQAQIANLNRQYEAMGRAERAAASGKELLNHINELQTELNAANEARQRFQHNVGNYETAIKNAIGLNNTFADSILSLSKNSATGEQSLTSFFSNASDSVKAFGKTLLSLLKNPVFLAIAGIVGAGVAFKFWYDYNKGLEEATRLTKQFTKLSGNELKAFRNEIIGISDAFGKDFKETLEATNSVASQFGISQQEALGYIKDGFVAGADVNGDYLEILNEYSAHFKEAGTSASEFIAIVSDTPNQGVFSDKGIDAIKEANIRIRQMKKNTVDALNNIGISANQVQKDLAAGTTTTFEVIQQVSQKLSELPPQSKEVGTAIADIFGGAGEDAGLQYLTTLKDIETNLDEVKKKSGELGEIQERQMKANIELQNAVSALFDQTGGTFESMIGNAKIFATESLTSIVKGLIDVVNWFIRLYNESENVRAGVYSLILAFKALFEIAKLGFTAILEEFKKIGSLISLIVSGDFKRFAEEVGSSNKNIADSFSAAWESVKNAAKDASEEIKNGNIDPIEIPVTVVPEGGTAPPKTSGGGVTGLTDEMKKAIEEERKAAVDLAKFMLETEIKNNRDIANDQKKAYDDRLKALNTYQNLQRSYIDLDTKNQLAQLRKKFSSEAEYQKYAANQIELINRRSNERINQLDKELADSSLKIMQDEENRRAKILTDNINNRLAIVKRGSDEELSLRLQQLEVQRKAEVDAAEKSGADIRAISNKYIALENKARQDQTDYINQQRQIDYENQILQAQINNQNTLSIEIEAKKAQIDALTKLDEESNTEFVNRQLSLNLELKRLNDEFLQYQLENQLLFLQSLRTVGEGFEDLFSTIAEDNKNLASFARAIALFNIQVSNAEALAKGIAAAQSMPFPKNLLAIATTVGTIASNFAKVYRIIRSSKEPQTPAFAQGGLVSGLGSGTSDSINARLSNGESVMTARTTSMFSPVLSALNQIGGGVPISTQDTSGQIMGEDMLTRSFYNAVLSIPNPVVSVSEINQVNSRVEVLENSRII